MAGPMSRFTTIDPPAAALFVVATPSPEVPTAMSVIVRVPTTLRTLTGGQSEVSVEGATVGDVLASLESVHPGFAERILDGDGGLRRFVNVFVADDDVRFLDALATPVPDGETVSIIPAVAGG
jgi:molybdopterin synthase sulfur carrier subunit